MFENIDVGCIVLEQQLLHSDISCVMCEQYTFVSRPIVC
jgi:hypothetical protein